MTPTEVTGLIVALAAILGAIATFYKLRPDRDVLMITQAQGASTILNDLVDTLREEIVRERNERIQAESENKALRKEIEGLRSRFGTRDTDPGV